MARDVVHSLLQRIMPGSPLKGLFLACTLILIIICDSGIVISATTSIPMQGDPSEAPPDYAASRLVGTMKGRGSSIVVFENAKGEQTYYRTGEKYSDGSKIITVTADSIIVQLSDGSQVEYFVAPGAMGKPGTAAVGRPVVNSAASYIPPGDTASENSRVSRKKRHKKLRGSEQEE